MRSKSAQISPQSLDSRHEWAVEMIVIFFVARAAPTSGSIEPVHCITNAVAGTPFHLHGEAEREANFVGYTGDVSDRFVRRVRQPGTGGRERVPVFIRQEDANPDRARLFGNAFDGQAPHGTSVDWAGCLLGSGYLDAKVSRRQKVSRQPAACR